MKADDGLLIKLESAELLKKTMGDYFLRLKGASESKSKKIAWCSSVGPVELLYSMGFEIHFPENHAAIIGSAKIAEKYMPQAVASGYSPDVCSYLKSDIGAFLAGETPLAKYGFKSLPKPDVLVLSTNQCREMEDWFAFYARHYGVPLLCVRAPSTVEEVTPGIIEYVAKQYRDIIPALENAAGQKFDINKFSEAIANSREACELWKNALDTAKHKPSPINFFDASVHMGPIVVMRGTKPPIEYYKTLLSELEGRIKKGIGAVPEEKYRLCWDGMPMWFKLRDMARLFARLKASVVASTYCNSWALGSLDPDDPFNSCAQSYTEIFIARTESIKERYLGEILADYSIDGIIYHDALTCMRNSNTSFGLPGRLHDKTRIPYLEIQGDLNDSRCYSEEQSVTAIETFIEQIGMRA